MIFRTVFFLILVMTLQACGGGNGGSAQSNISDENSATKKEDNASVKFLDLHYYRVVLPDNGYDENKAYKLLLAFHGSEQSERGMQNMTRFESLSDDYIVVYPKSREVEWDDGCGCNIADRLEAKDVEFIVALIEEMHKEYNLIEGENYAVGYSQGGLFSQNMLCKHSELFKAVASVASPMSVQLAATCRISTPTNYLLVQGTADGVLPYFGLNDSNFGLISAPRAIATIAKQNQLGAEYSDTQSTDAIKNRVYQSDTGIINKLVTVVGGGHAWSFGTFDTSKEVLNFFDNSSDVNLSTGSALHLLSSGDYHVRSVGQRNEYGEIVILAGGSLESSKDAPWASSVQSLLAPQGRVHVIEKLGNSWRRHNAKLDQSEVVKDLSEILSTLDASRITFVTNSDSNLAALMYAAQQAQTIKVNGMVWVDPDMLQVNTLDYETPAEIASVFINNTSVPISIVDSGFVVSGEAHSREAQSTKLAKQLDEKRRWGKDITYKTQGVYYPLNNISAHADAELSGIVQKAVLSLIDNEK